MINSPFITIKRTRGYKNFRSNCSSDKVYNVFIDYITQYTYNSLSNQEFLEVQKKKVSDKFITALTQYLSDI